MMDWEKVKQKMREINQINSKFNLVRVARLLNFAEYSLQKKFPILADVVFFWKQFVFVLMHLSIVFPRKNRHIYQLLMNELDFDVLDVLSGKKKIKVYVPARNKGFYNAVFSMYASLDLLKIKRVQNENAYEIRGGHRIDIKKLQFNSHFVEEMTESQEYLRSHRKYYPDTYLFLMRREFERKTIFDIPYEFILYIYETQLFAESSLK